MVNKSLPAWASEAGENAYGMPVVRVDADAAYTALLKEYRKHYSVERNRPGEWRNKDGELSKEWRDVLAGLDPDAPDAYWLEVCYQSIKLDLQVAMKGFTFEVRIKDPNKRWAQAFMWLGDGKSGPRPQGRGPDAATKDREARQHYKRLRGFVPS